MRQALAWLVVLVFGYVVYKSFHLRPKRNHDPDDSQPE